MKVLIVYDSVYGNTDKIVKAIGGAITSEFKMLHTNEVTPAEFEAVSRTSPVVASKYVFVEANVYATFSYTLSR
jgi:flavodoxin